MKKLLTAFVLLSCVYTSASAQKFSIGLRGGLNYSTPPLRLRDNSAAPGRIHTDFNGGVDRIVGIKAAFNIKHFQFGASYDLGRLHYNYQDNFDKIGTINYSSRQGFSQFIVFVNYKSLLRRSYIYYGLNAGLINLPHTRSATKFSSTTPPRTTQFPLGANYFFEKVCITYGMQIGYNYKLNKHFSLEGEAGLRLARQYVYVNSYHPQGGVITRSATRGIAYFPVTAGINYTF